MKLVFLGPPGVGKGTQAKLYCKRKGFAHISTGDMLRREMEKGSDLGLEVKSVIEKGLLVSDELMMRLVEARLAEPDCQSGYVLDGFPRTIPQAQAFHAYLDRNAQKLDNAVLFDVSRDELYRRLEGRRALESRADDNIEVQKERIRVYEAQTAPLNDFYANKGLLVKIESSGTVDEIAEVLDQVLRSSCSTSSKCCSCSK